MTIIFYLFGGLVEVAGVFLLIAVLASPATQQAFQQARSFGGSSVELLTIAASLGPGVGLMVAGLFLLAIAGVLSRLDSIKGYNRRAARALEGLARGETPAN